MDWWVAEGTDPGLRGMLTFKGVCSCASAASRRRVLSDQGLRTCLRLCSVKHE
jgi:hypothetical protein